MPLCLAARLVAAAALAYRGTRNDADGGSLGGSRGGSSTSCVHRCVSLCSRGFGLHASRLLHLLCVRCHLRPQRRQFSGLLRGCSTPRRQRRLGGSQLCTQHGHLFCSFLCSTCSRLETVLPLHEKTFRLLLVCCSAARRAGGTGEPACVAYGHSMRENETRVTRRQAGLGVRSAGQEAQPLPSAPWCILPRGSPLQALLVRVLHLSLLLVCSAHQVQQLACRRNKGRRGKKGVLRGTGHPTRPPVLWLPPPVFRRAPSMSLSCPSLRRQQPESRSPPSSFATVSSSSSVCPASAIATIAACACTI